MITEGYLGDTALRARLREEDPWFRKAREAVVAAAETAGVALRLVRPRREDRYRTCVPLVLLQAAAGAFGV